MVDLLQLHPASAAICSLEVERGTQNAQAGFVLPAMVEEDEEDKLASEKKLPIDIPCQKLLGGRHHASACCSSHMADLAYRAQYGSSTASKRRRIGEKRSRPCASRYPPSPIATVCAGL